MSQQNKDDAFLPKEYVDIFAKSRHGADVMPMKQLEVSFVSLKALGMISISVKWSMNWGQIGESCLKSSTIFRLRLLPLVKYTKQSH